MGDDRDDPTELHVEGGSARVDEDDLPDADDLRPDDPPADAPTRGDRDARSAISAPVPAHGEMASGEQLDEATTAAEEDEAEAEQAGSGADDRD